MPSYKANVVYMSDDLCTIVATSDEDLHRQLRRIARSLGIEKDNDPDVLWADVFKATQGGWVRDRAIHHNDLERAEA